MNAPRLTEAAEEQEGSGIAAGRPLLDRFWVASLTFQRARQLERGARPRLEPDGHKHARVALLEVVAGLVSAEVRGAQPALEHDGAPD